jgi:hypothetical protein
MKQMHGWLVFFVRAVFALSPVLSADAEASEKFLIKQSSEQIENLEDFGTHEFSPGREEADDVSSFIATVTLEPAAAMPQMRKTSSDFSWRWSSNDIRY